MREGPYWVSRCQAVAVIIDTGGASSGELIGELLILASWLPAGAAAAGTLVAVVARRGLLPFPVGRAGVPGCLALGSGPRRWPFVSPATVVAGVMLRVRRQGRWARVFCFSETLA